MAKYRAIANHYMELNGNPDDYGMNILYIQTSRRGIKDVKSMKLLRNAYPASIENSNENETSFTIPFKCFQNPSSIYSTDTMVDKLRRFYAAGGVGIPEDQFVGNN